MGARHSSGAHLMIMSATGVARSDEAQRGIASLSSADTSSLRSTAQTASISGWMSWPFCQLSASIRSFSSISASFSGLTALPRAA